MAALTPVIEAHELYRFFHTGDDEVMALRGVSLQVASGEIVAVIGPSGSGKSTLLTCLCGLDEPDGGYVELLGQRVTRRPEAERAAMRGESIGVMLQSRNLFDHLSVSENIALPMQLAHRRDAHRVTQLVRQVGLDERRDARPGALSGGEAARAGLAVALAMNPTLLLADEPTGEVDAATEADILALFADRRATGGATLIVTHSAAVMACADRIIRLADGRLVHD